MRCTISIHGKCAIWLYALNQEATLSQQILYFMLCSGYISVREDMLFKVLLPADNILNNVYNVEYVSVCVCVRLPLCVQQRNDDEAVVDRRGTRSQQGTNFEKEDLEGTWTDTECIWNAKSVK